MKYFYLALACLLSPFFGQAQANFKKGFVVNTQGDTLRGFINYQELGGKEPRSLSFKTTEADKIIQELTPAACKYVDITGLVTYQSYLGRISMDATSLKYLSTNIDTTTRAVNIYLRVVQQGKNVSLYAYTDEVKTRYFLQKKNEMIQELGLKKYYYNQTNNIRTLKNYIGQLWLTAIELQSGTPALQKKIESAQYYGKDLVAIVSHLNQLEQQQKSNIRFFAGLGITRTNFTVEGNHDLAKNTNSKASYFPKISLGLDILQNRHTQQFFFRGEIGLHLATADISSLHKEYALDKVLNQSFLQPTVSLAPQLVYNLYNRENLKLNLGIGASFNFSTYANNMYHTHSTNRSDGTVYSDKKIKNQHQFSAIWCAFPIRAGLILNQKIDISVIYFMPTAITRYHSYSFSRSSLQVGVNYLFNRKGK